MPFNKEKNVPDMHVLQDTLQETCRNAYSACFRNLSRM